MGFLIASPGFTLFCVVAGHESSNILLEVELQSWCIKLSAAYRLLPSFAAKTARVSKVKENVKFKLVQS